MVRAKAKAKAEAEPPPTSEVASAESNGINKEFLAEIAALYEKICSHEVFRDLRDAGALDASSAAEEGAGDGDLETPAKRARMASRSGGTKKTSQRSNIHGMQAAFDLAEYQTAMKLHGTYRCGGNELWLDFWFTAQPGVPYNKTSILQLAEKSFFEPKQWTGTNVVMVPDLAYNPMEHQGALRRLSPEEVNFARIIGIANAIDREASKDVLEAFKVDLQSAAFQFELHEGGIDNPSHTAIRRSINLREQMRQTAKAVGRDTLQRIFEVLRIRRLMEQSRGAGKVSNEALAQYYENEINLSTESEAVTSTVINQTSVVYNNILKDGKNLAILRSLSEQYGHNNPLNSMTKLNTVLTKCDKQPTLITWVLEKIRDVVTSGMLDVGEVSNRALKESAGGHKGLVDLFVIKKQLLVYLLATDIDRRLRGSGSSKRRDEIVDLLGSHSKYRSKLSPIGNEPDLTFLAEYKDSEKMTIRAYENLIYGTEFDAQLRYCARLKKTPDEIVETDAIKAELDRIDAQVALELAVDDVQVWRVVARRRIGESAKLICDSGSSEAALVATLQASEIAKLPGDAHGHVLIHCDLDLLTESQTAPRTRQPPARKPQLSRLINSVIALRKAANPYDNGCKLIRGDVFLFRDGGKRTIADFVSKHLVAGRGRWNSVARQENLVKLWTHVMISEDSLKGRRSRVRGVGALKQLTGLHACMFADTVIPEKARSVYSGTNMGDVLGPVGFQKWAESWKCPLDVKKAMYGDNVRPVGGRNPGDNGDSDGDEGGGPTTAAAAAAEDEDDDKNRPNFQLDTANGKKKAEPGFWWALPVAYYKEVKHSYYGRRIIDLSPGPGNFLIATWEETPPTPYIGVCFGPSHQAELQEHLVDEYLAKMCTEGHPVYNKDYAKFKNESTTTSAAPPPPPDPQPKQRATAGAKRAAAKRAAASAAAGAAADAEADAEAGGDDEGGGAAAAAVISATGGGSLESLLAGIH
ncbi:unnamed protein product [Prorocentrum cordatum]|uniref:Uncharacterized protein n=1 Tax=Prorocentrum cordatum TaxID=2364126 RepID=A0ABN9Y4M6_9DINO|nr:unnamed protein product [Polarella glacialis]